MNRRDLFKGAVGVVAGTALAGRVAAEEIFQHPTQLDGLDARYLEWDDYWNDPDDPLGLPDRLGRWGFGPNQYWLSDIRISGAGVRQLNEASRGHKEKSYSIELEGCMIRGEGEPLDFITRAGPGSRATRCKFERIIHQSYWYSGTTSGIQTSDTSAPGWTITPDPTVNDCDHPDVSA